MEYNFMMQYDKIPVQGLPVNSNRRRLIQETFFYLFFVLFGHII
jgi:hypothetical protein